ncbi:MAG: Asp-tRNA(Asn)/Glu-tRNA(Gln) amidotransferase subunit GatC [Gammaproteobacteria bacterium]
MSLDIDTVRTVANLAQIGIPENELGQMQAELSPILGLVEQLQAVNTDGIEPLAHAVDITPTYRSDVVTESDQRHTLQMGAPAVENGLYLVPRVIESCS